MNIKYSDEKLQTAVRESKTWKEVCFRITESNNSSSLQTHFKKRCINLAIDFSHFKGLSWNKGNTQSTKIDLKDMFCENSFVARHSVRRYLMGDPKFVHQCELCDNKEWNNEPIPLVLDHINGVRNDNRRENLRFICPNCDAQTDTYKGKNIKKTLSDSELLEVISQCNSINEVCQKAKISSHGNSYDRIRNLMEQNNISLLASPEKQGTRYSKKPCPICAKEILSSSPCCKSCCAKSLRKTEWPTPEELQKLVWEKPTTQIAKDFGVSDNAISKWCKNYDITKPSRGYWAKQKSLETSNGSVG